MRWFVVVVFAVLVCLQTLAFAAEESKAPPQGESVATEKTGPWAAEFSWENAVSWHKGEGARAYAFDLRAVPEWTNGDFTLGGEFVLHGERNTPNQGFEIEDTLLYAKYAAVDTRGFVLGPKLDFTLPTQQSRRRDEGFRGAPGGGFYAEWTNAFGLIEWESNLLRAMRSGLPAAPAPAETIPLEGGEGIEAVPATDLPPTLAELTRWEMFHEMIATVSLGRGFEFSQRARWTRAWSGDGAIADVMTSEQLFAYDRDTYRVEAGHLFERELRSRTGERRAIALASPTESQIVGNLILKL